MYIVNTYHDDGEKSLSNVVMDYEESLRLFLRTYTQMTQAEEDTFIDTLNEKDSATYKPQVNTSTNRAISVEYGQALHGYA